MRERTLARAEASNGDINMAATDPNVPTSASNGIGKDASNNGTVKKQFLTADSDVAGTRSDDDTSQTPTPISSRSRSGSTVNGIAPRKPIKLRNICSRAESMDLLHHKAPASHVECNARVCVGSLMATVPSGQRTEPRPAEEVVALAKEFLDEYYASIKRLNSESHMKRWESVLSEIKEKGTYELTETEVIYGAKLAWRNAQRCIGRIQWQKLQVFDARSVTTAGGMYEALCNHIKYASNKGNIRSAITIFPQRREAGKDFRVWNQQLVAFAGYRQPGGSVIGDPINVEFTEVCQKLGWKGKNGRFDILPLVLSANGQDPEYFDIPEDLVITVPIKHPKYTWFAEMGLKWFALPAVAGMLFDCGGIEFPGAPFSGWYMVTEIAARDLCDPQRYNILEDVARKMGLDMSNPATMWKDQALVEVHVAVMHSFQSNCVTLVDHHTASESFMKHLENENRLRGGCPADWVWIVPPISGSITQVYHQEMALYYLKPSYEYQVPPWKTHVWKKVTAEEGSKPRRKFRFKEIARAVKFTSRLFQKALSKRIKATILYATETGKSEKYAKLVGELFSHAFNAQVIPMNEYDVIDMEHEALILVVTSTFGNGDPPENGEEFAKHLYASKLKGTVAHGQNITEEELHKFLAETVRAHNKKLLEAPEEMVKPRKRLPAPGKAAVGDEKRVNSKVLMRMSSSSAEMPGTPTAGNSVDFSNLDGNSDAFKEEHSGPLVNVRFGVFALGSSAYPNFASFGKYVDACLGDLGGERIVRLTCGDEMCGQEQAFKGWAKDVFQAACETFCIDDKFTLLHADATLTTDIINESMVRFESRDKEDELRVGLTKLQPRKVVQCKLISNLSLHGLKSADRATLQVCLDTTVDPEHAEQLKFEPGDHVGIFPSNRPEIVEGILSRLSNCPVFDKPVQLYNLKETQTQSGTMKEWQPHKHLSPASVRTILQRYVDITTPPSTDLLLILALYASDENDKKRLEELAKDPAAYQDWRVLKYPHLLEVLQEFPSVKPDAALLIQQLPVLQPRFYSISSSGTLYRGEIHLTVGVVTYSTQGGNGPVHYGVCSNYLREAKEGETILCFVRHAPSFRLPKNTSKPIIMVGPGTGIAPFRSFWQERYVDVVKHGEDRKNRFGPMTLFFGCRFRPWELYRFETREMVAAGVLTNVHVALSREPNHPKTYVQDLMRKEAKTIYSQMMEEGGHFYVCGDCTMAEHTYRTLREIIQIEGCCTELEADSIMLSIKDQNRYHEDIFGITLRTEEVHDKQRILERSKLSLESSRLGSVSST